MQNFAKSILNYFATYTETRFRFSTKQLAFQWADSVQHDLSVLDLGVFPQVQRLISDCVAANQPIQVTIQKGEHIIRLDGQRVTRQLLSFLESEATGASLETLLHAHGFYQEQKNRPVGDEATDLFDLPVDRGKAWLAACRQYNLKLGEEYARQLVELKQAKLEALRAELLLTNAFPQVSLNVGQEKQCFLDQLQRMATQHSRSEAFVVAIRNWMQAEVKDYLLFDLFMVLNAYQQGSQVWYLYFHDIGREGEAHYPLFCAEVELCANGDTASIRSLRDVFMVNTPAVNSFDFESVLTTPRACRFAEASHTLGQIEQFLLGKYRLQDAFLCNHGFAPLVGHGLPEVRFRVALQAAREEDRRILDYSSLLTSLDEGAGHKFINLVGQYVCGNVKNTADAVAAAYAQRYPRKSIDRLLHPASQIPLPLNEPQKRILLAAEDATNRFIVVDGPPGTGKSHTITALIYQATLMGKSVLVTSHKQQALDVIDDALTEQFRSVHPRAKPPVLRLTSQDANRPSNSNDPESMLATPRLAAASQRYLAGNPEAVARDRDALLTRIDADNRELWKSADTYPGQIQDTFEWFRLHGAIFGDEAAASATPPARPASGSALDVGRLKAIATILQRPKCRTPLQGLCHLSNRRDALPDVMLRCNRLNFLRDSLCGDLVAGDQPMPANLAAFEALLDELAPACRNDEPLPQANALPSQIPAEAFCTLPDIRSSQDLAQVRAALQAMAGQEKKFFGRFRRDEGVEKLRHELQQRFPSIARQANESLATATLGRCDTTAKQVASACQNFPWLDPDYLIGGHLRIPPDRLLGLLRDAGSLEYHEVARVLAMVCKRGLAHLPFGELRAKVRALRQLAEYRDHLADLAPLARDAGLAPDDFPSLYAFLKTAADLLGVLANDDLALLSSLFHTYPSALAMVDGTAEDLRSLGPLADATGKTADLLRYIELHDRLARLPEQRLPSRQAIGEFHAKTHKLLDHQMDGRFKGFQNYAGDVQKILIAIKAGLRISDAQARILFGNLTCVIAEPKLISRHLPMTEDLVDYLIIDEASQVSIADSISLMLRAKQVIVFGDELQYGAVGAISVSERYAEQYFRDILRDYAADLHAAISEEERDRIARAATREISEEEQESGQVEPVSLATKEWLKTFSVRTSTLSFAKALNNYADSLNIHFRSFPEIISYSNKFFYSQSQIELVPNRIRTKPIREVLRFLHVKSKGNSGRNVNLDEIEAIKTDLEQVHASRFQGTIGVICAFKEQTARMQDILRKELRFHADLEHKHRFKVWFVGDVQGEERDLIYYSLVQDKEQDNADLVSIYPKTGGSADNIRRLKMQRLNVGFSRARDTMVFVHSMPISEYSDTRLGDALKHYANLLEVTHDIYVEDETVFGSEAERALYQMITQTRFFDQHRKQCRLIAQFEIGKYIREEYQRYIPSYRVDFLLTMGGHGREKSLVIEYDGVEFHTRNPETVTAHNFSQEYLEYDLQRQLELEGFGYTFLRINKFSLLSRRAGETPVDVLNGMLERAFA